MARWRDKAEVDWIENVSSPEVEAAWRVLEDANDELVDLDRERKRLERVVDVADKESEAHIAAKARLRKLNEKIREVGIRHTKADRAYEQAIKDGFAKYKAEQERISSN